MRIISFMAAGIMLAGPATASTLTPIGSFNGSTGYPQGTPLVLGGVVYGVLGFAAPPNGTDLNGIVFALTPPASGTTYTQATISSFSGGTTGGNPVGALHADASGNLYGAAFSGGSTAAACKADGVQGCGLIYELTKSGTTWTRTAIYTFTGGKDGIGPVGNLISDSTGALYGVTEGGGARPPSIIRSAAARYSSSRRRPAARRGPKPFSTRSRAAPPMAPSRWAQLPVTQPATFTALRSLAAPRSNSAARCPAAPVIRAAAWYSSSLTTQQIKRTRSRS